MSKTWEKYEWKVLIGSISIFVKKLGLKIQQVGSNILTFRTMKFTHKTKCLTENLKQFRMAWKLRAELKYLAHTNTNFCRKNDLDSIFRSYLKHSECCILQWFCKCVKLNFFDNIYKKNIKQIYFILNSLSSIL